MKTILGTEGGHERVIFCVSSTGFYLAVRPWRRYYRLAIFMLPWFPRVYVGRS